MSSAKVSPDPSAPLGLTQQFKSTDVMEKSRCITSDQLLAGAKELLIQHNGETYCLRLTRKGKLILTK